MAIDRAEALRIARLARLDLADGEIESLACQLGSVLDYVALLDEFESSPAEDVADASAGVGPRALRADDPRPGLAGDQALAGAPDAASGFFRVPRSFPE